MVSSAMWIATSGAGTGARRPRLRITFAGQTTRTRTSAPACCHRGSGFHAERTEGSTKYGVTIGFQPGIDGANQTGIAGAPIDGGLGLNTSNFRQVFLEWSGGWGGIKIGRDLGIFGSDAILSDMTLLGVGTVSDLTRGGGNTTLGRIGVGYLYADWKGQIQYSSPKFGGFSFNIAVVDPWGLVDLSGASSRCYGTFNQEAPDFLGSNGWEGKLNYAWEGDFNGKGLGELHLSEGRKRDRWRRQ